MELLVYANEMFRLINQADCSLNDLKSTTMTAWKIIPQIYYTLMLKKDFLALWPL